MGSSAGVSQSPPAGLEGAAGGGPSRVAGGRLKRSVPKPVWSAPEPSPSGRSLSAARFV